MTINLISLHLNKHFLYDRYFIDMFHVIMRVFIFCVFVSSSCPDSSSKVLPSRQEKFLCVSVSCSNCFKAVRCAVGSATWKLWEFDDVMWTCSTRDCRFRKTWRSQFWNKICHVGREFISTKSQEYGWEEPVSQTAYKLFFCLLFLFV